MMLGFRFTAEEGTKGAVVSGVQCRAFGKVGCMHHSVENVFGSTSPFSGKGPFIPRESIHKVRGPPRGFVGVDPLHI